MNTTLAQWSNLFVYAAMGVFTLAMISFAVSFAASRGRADQAAAEDRRRRAEAITGTKAPATVPATVTAWGLAADGPDGVATSGDSDAPTAEQPSAPSTPGDRSANIAVSLSWLGFLLLVTGVVLRAVWAQRVPWGNMYEFSLTSATAIAGVYLVANLKRDLRWLGVFVLPIVLLTLGLAVTVLYTDAAQLVPALKSYWLIIHVSAAVICAGGFALGALVTGIYLFRARAEAKAAQAGREVSGVATRFPDSGALDGLAYRVHAFVFPLWTFAIIAGSIWAEDAWGRYWGWDPKETWAFITWVIYAGYLHARSTAGWRGKKAAVVALLGFAAFLFNYFGVNMLFSGLHSYSGV